MLERDPNLRPLLRGWRVEFPAEPGFNSAVWRRIAAAEDRGLSGTWARMGDWLLVQLPRPVYASALLLFTALLSSLAAGVRASHERERVREQYARRYLVSIDPLSMVENQPRPR